MSSNDHPLDRLLRAAAAAPAPGADELPFALEASVLADWREPGPENSVSGLLPFLRAGLAVASLVMALAVTLSLMTLSRATVDEWSLPDTAVNLALTQ